MRRHTSERGPEQHERGPTISRGPKGMGAAGALPATLDADDGLSGAGDGNVGDGALLEGGSRDAGRERRHRGQPSHSRGWRSLVGHAGGFEPWKESSTAAPCKGFVVPGSGIAQLDVVREE